MLQNPAYKGWSVANRFERYEFRNPETGHINRKRERTRPVEEWTILAPELTPAIVGEDLWDRANQRLSVRVGVVRKNRARPYLLRGRVKCATCGGPMYSETAHGTNVRTYRCAQG